MNTSWDQHIISIDALSATKEDTVIIDCRFDLMNPSAGRQLYMESHIPGAYYFDLNQDLSSPITRHGGRHPLPDISQFTQRLRECGVNENTRIVAYDDNKSAFAGRLWFLCHYIGHTQVKILNGGFSAWRKAGLAVTAIVPPLRDGNLQAEIQAGQVLTYNDVKALSDNLPAGTLLIDSREEPRYLGLQEPIDPIAGHIPGAENLPWATAVDENGMLLEPVLQAKRWEKFDPQNNSLVVYCGSGVTACVNMLSLALQGITHAKLYAGSWSDWCSYQLHPTEAK